MRFKVLYFLFVLFYIAYPHKEIIGPITIRHIMSILMLGYCLFEGFRLDKYLYLYLAFILFFGLSSIITGFSGAFFRVLFGTYITMIAAYAATYLLIKKHNGNSLLVRMFVFIGVLNAFITIGQFYNLVVVDNLCSFLRIEIDEDFLNIISESQESEGIALPGILGSVNNGYFLSATALLMLYNYYSRFYVNILLWLLVMVASFLAQERAGFMLALVFSAFIIGKRLLLKGNKVLIVSFLLLFCVCVTVASSYLDSLFLSDFRYSKGLESGERDQYRLITWDYVFNNPLGGFFEFDSIGHHHPHIFFLNAFLFGGFFGGICVIVLFLIQVKRIIPYLFGKFEGENGQRAFIWGLMYIDYCINSMVHNASIVQGVMIFFIWWGAFLAYAELNEEALVEVQEDGH